MSWDSYKRFTLERFQEVILIQAKRTLTGDLRPVVNTQRYTPLWFTNKEIRIFWEQGIETKTAQLVKEATEERFREVGFDPFRVELYGQHQSVDDQIAASLVCEELDEQKLFELCLTESRRDPQAGGCQHADIIITKHAFLNDLASWGAASFAHGTMMLTLHGNRQHNRRFLQNVSLHEVNHLLGMCCHCDHFQNVEGFSYEPDCNMHYSCSTPKLCYKCIEFIQCWWTQINHELSQGLG